LSGKGKKKKGVRERFLTRKIINTGKEKERCRRTRLGPSLILHEKRGGGDLGIPLGEGAAIGKRKNGETSFEVKGGGLKKTFRMSEPTASFPL